MSDNLFNATIFDVMVVTLGGWKLFGHADLSWWQVVIPWFVSLALGLVVLLIAGIWRVLEK